MRKTNLIEIYNHFKPIKRKEKIMKRLIKQINCVFAGLFRKRGKLKLFPTPPSEFVSITVNFSALWLPVFVPFMAIELENKALMICIFLSHRVVDRIELSKYC